MLIGTSVLYNEQEGKFKMWYKSSVTAEKKKVTKDGAPDSSEEDPGKEQWYACYAEGVDGINWTRPVIGKFNFQGSTQNCLYFPVFDR